MGFDAVIRGGIATLDSVTKSLQATVTIFPWLGQDGFGKPILAATGVAYKAIVEYDPAPDRGANGVTLVVKAKVMILQPIPPTTPNANMARLNPIDNRDKVVLPNGTTGPIVGTPGVVDPTTNRPYFAEILIGKV